MCTDTDDEVVEGDLSLADITFDVTCICTLVSWIIKVVPVMVIVLLTGSIEVQSASKNCTAAFLYLRICLIGCIMDLDSTNPVVVDGNNAINISLPKHN